MTLRVLDLAGEEAADAAQWYNARTVGLGDRFYAVYTDALDAIEQNPLRFPKLETYRGARHIRRCRVGKFPYIVVFEVKEDELLVIAVAHTSRRPNYWRRRS